MTASTPDTRVQRIQPQAGDVFVIAFPTLLRKDAADKLSEELSQTYFGGEKVLILQGGARLEAVIAARKA